MTDFPSMGATVFFGLTAVALLGHSPPDEGVNPKDTHKATPFEQDRAQIEFAHFISWSVPLGSVDFDPADQAGPFVEIAAAAAPLPSVEFGPIHASFASRTRLTEPNGGPITPALDVVLGRPDRDVRRAGLTPVPVTPLGARPRVIPESAARVELLASAPPAPNAQRQNAPSAIARSTQSALPSAPAPQIDRLARLSPDRTLENPRAPFAANVTGDLVHLRTRPSREGASLGKFNVGTSATFLEQVDDWALVVIDGPMTGWMFAEYLEPAPKAQ